jgi:5-formyltetrahydrofolate cyclo-ligase
MTVSNPSPSIDIAFVKNALRRDMLARRNALDEEERKIAAENFTDNFLRYITLQPQDIAALYYPIRSEISVLPLLKELHARGQTCALPTVTADNTLIFRTYAPGDSLAQSPLSIMEPLPAAQKVIPSLLVVPLLGFDRTGYRLGYGLGFYDRSIQKLRAAAPDCRCIGAAFAIQEVKALPHDSHDMPLNAIVTDREIISLQSNS